MSIPNVGAILNVVRNAQAAVSGAINFVNEFKDTGVILNSESEEQLETEIKKLEDMLPNLRRATQEKLRGG